MKISTVASRMTAIFFLIISFSLMLPYPRSDEVGNYLTPGGIGVFIAGISSYVFLRRIGDKSKIFDVLDACIILIFYILHQYLMDQLKIIA